MELKVARHVLVTSWLETREGLTYVKAVEVARSPIPSGPLYNVFSPTKVVEYMALGVLVVGNDIPDQDYLLRKSCAGISVPFDVQCVVDATSNLLDNPKLAREIGARGPALFESERSYRVLAKMVAMRYQRLLPEAA